MDLFEKASKGKFRFSLTTRGVLSTEDLWDLKLEDLDKLAKGLNKEIKDSGEESFITTVTKTNQLANDKFEVVKHIIKVKLEEKEKRALSAQRAAKRAELISIIEDKEKGELRNKSIEELKKELEDYD